MLCHVRIVACVLAAGVLTASCAPNRVTVPFDRTTNLVAMDARIRGTPVTLILDTAVTPSVIDRDMARSLGLGGEAGPIGEASGTGSGNASVFPARLTDLQIGRLKVASVEAVAFDMKPLSAKFGKPLQAILGESFLKQRTIIIDYPRQRVTIYKSAADAERAIAGCGLRYRQHLEFVPDDVAPKLVITVGSSRVPVSLDTGSVLGLELYDGALPAADAARLLKDRRSKTLTGARGQAQVSEARYAGVVQLGPFRWDEPTVVLSGAKGSAETRLGNLGNRFLQQNVLLLDYQRMLLGLFSECGG